MSMLSDGLTGEGEKDERVRFRGRRSREMRQRNGRLVAPRFPDSKGWFVEAKPRARGRLAGFVGAYRRRALAPRGSSYLRHPAHRAGPGKQERRSSGNHPGGPAGPGTVFGALLPWTLALSAASSARSRCRCPNVCRLPNLPGSPQRLKPRSATRRRAPAASAAEAAAWHGAAFRVSLGLGGFQRSQARALKRGQNFVLAVATVAANRARPLGDIAPRRSRPQRPQNAVYDKAVILALEPWRRGCSAARGIARRPSVRV